MANRVHGEKVSRQRSRGDQLMIEQNVCGFMGLEFDCWLLLPKLTVLTFGNSCHRGLQALEHISELNVHMVNRPLPNEREELSL
jgi:hypothetical protein